MRRIPRLLAAGAAVLVLPLADVAAAREHDGWGGRGGGWQMVDERSGPGHGRGGPGWGHGAGAPPGWGRPPGHGGHGPVAAAPPPGYYPPPAGYYAPRGYEPPRGGFGIRRGGRLPPDVRAEVVPDLRRYRLRPPPRGYTWVRVGNAFLLMNTATGQIFDMIAD